MFLNIEDDYRIYSEKKIKYNDNVLTTLKENNYTDNHEADKIGFKYNDSSKRKNN